MGVKKCVCVCGWVCLRPSGLTYEYTGETVEEQYLLRCESSVFLCVYVCVCVCCRLTGAFVYSHHFAEGHRSGSAG